jgi:hypothetical protein
LNAASSSGPSSSIRHFRTRNGVGAPASSTPRPVAEGGLARGSITPGTPAQEKRLSFFSTFAIRLSRACLGKSIVFV